MRTAPFAILGSLLVLALAANCTIPDLESDGGICPCAPGYDCIDKTFCRRSTGQAAGGAGGFGGAGGGAAAGSGAASSDGGTTSTANPIGSGGAGGVGCLPNGWSEEADLFWDRDDLCPDPLTACSVSANNGHQVLCCEDDADHTSGGGGPVIAAYQKPSTQSKAAGQLWTHVSWFACWVRGESFMGNPYWLYTQLDLKTPSKWGYVPAYELLGTPPGNFVTLNPKDSALPECACPPP